MRYRAPPRLISLKNIELMNSHWIQAIRSVFRPALHGSVADHHRQILEDYRNRRPRYEDFCVAVHRVLDTLLREGGYKYQIIFRTKTSEKLKEKLIRKDAQGRRYASLEEIEDLAGLRVVFYSEHDKRRFLDELRNEISGSIRIEEKAKRSGYHATHLIISFGPNRLNLSEYKQFESLKSEVQVTSILHHAWAEIEHDFIYKDIYGLKVRDPKKFRIMEQKLMEILE
ncbi:MAG: hypothetical protein ABIS68_08365, partial [Casimicrobiaceae bacterium]